MTQIKILIVDDQELFRKALSTLLTVEKDFHVVGDASNGEEAIRLATLLQPNIILMDLRMPIMDGVAATRRIHSSLPHIKVIILTTFDEDEDVFEGLRAGAVGYLLKDVSTENLIAAIKAADRGEYALLPSITARVVAEFTRISASTSNVLHSTPLLDPLTDRELEILQWVAKGASNKEIADGLVISEGTVKNHLTKILTKLDVKDRLQAVLKAKELNIV
jgi:DNA-binding NarL/FixJ family response regulator